MTLTPARAIAAAAVLAGLALAAYLLWPDEERRLRARMRAGADALSAPEGETDFARLARMASLRGFLVEDAEVSFAREGEAPVRGREAIVGLAARALAPLGARVELGSVEVTLRSGRTVADVRAEVRLVTRDPGGGASVVDGRFVSLTWKKVGRTWLVASVRVMPRDDSITDPGA